MSYPFGETEFKVENETGFSLERETGKVTPWSGIRIRWRFIGERKWRKIVLVPDADQEQTPETLKRNAAEIVETLAAEVARNGET